MKILYCALTLSFIFIIIYGAGAIQCKLQDNSITTNTFGAFTSTVWSQTSQADFLGDSRTQVDTNTTPGDVLLAIQTGKNHFSTGSINSTVKDTGHQGTRIDLLAWNDTVPAQTGITFYIRASDTPFAANDKTVPWVAVGAVSPVSKGLPAGEYVQWRAILSTSKPQQTPALKDFEVWYH